LGYVEFVSEKWHFEGRSLVSVNRVGKGVSIR